MINCQICQVSNEDSAQFCRECGGRLQNTPVAPPASTHSEPELSHEPPKRPKLRSPILGGGDDMDDDEPAPSFKKVKGGQSATGPNSSQSGTGGQRRGGLRSPLLGGDDDMDEEEIQPRGKGGFGHFPGGGKSKKTEFPHRHHDEIDGHDAGHSPMAGQAGTGGQKATGNRGGLRSPLLGGGDDFDDDEIPESSPRGGGRPRPAAKPGKLRSPILGGGGGDDYYDDEVFDEEEPGAEINDPTVLRSPLLAVRTPRAHAKESHTAMPAHQPSPNASQTQMPAAGRPEPPRPMPPQGAGTSSSTANFAVSGGPSAAAAPQSQVEMNFRGGPQYQPFPPNPSAQGTIVAPQAPSQQPAYSPPPAPPAPPGFAQSQSGSAPRSAGPAVAEAGPGGPAFAAQGEQYNFGLASNLASNLANPMNSAAVPQSAPPKPAPPSGPSASSTSLQSQSSNYQAPLPPAPSPSPRSTQPNQQALPPNPSVKVQSPGDIPTPNVNKPSARATGTKFDAADGEEAEPVKPRGLRGSKLLGDVTDDPIGPMDRRSQFGNDRRNTPRGKDRRAGLPRKEDALADDMDRDLDREPVSTLRGASYTSGGGSSAPNPMAPLLMIAAVVALICKGVYIASFKMDVLLHNIPGLVEQIGQIGVLVALILFSMKAMGKSK